MVQVSSVPASCRPRQGSRQRRMLRMVGSTAISLSGATTAVDDVFVRCAGGVGEAWCVLSTGGTFREPYIHVTSQRPFL